MTNQNEIGHKAERVCLFWSDMKFYMIKDNMRFLDEKGK